MAIPVVLDTDIGTDVDDVWALVFLLSCPEVDVKLITTATGDTGYRARLVGKILREMDREDIPIGVGIPLDSALKTHDAWLGDYSLDDFPGEVHRDGVGAICDTVLAADEPVTLLAIGPLPNVAAALQREPEITQNSRFVGMHGSLKVGYLGAAKPAREYNVRLHALACQSVFRSRWSKTITPLDTCGDIILEGDGFARVAAADTAAARIVMENHRLWCEACSDWPVVKQLDVTRQSSILFDCVAAYLAFDEAFLDMEELPVVVTDDGKTLIDDSGLPVACAMRWRDRPGFMDLLVERLTT